MKAQADKVLKEAVSRGDVPGVTAAATDARGTTYEAGFGKRVLGEPADMTPDTVAWIASMTKAITGAAAMQLVERGKLALDSPAKAVVPQLGEVGVLDGVDASGKPTTRKPKRDITLRHLLTHTAGFGYDIWSPEVGKYMEAMEVPGVISCQNKALSTPLLFDPGERWYYGNNIEWAGKMVEAASGSNLDRYLKDNVLRPLGMHDTSFKISPSQRLRLARIHQRDDKGALTPVDLELPQEPEFYMGGGGLYGTAGDYLSFTRMILQGGTLNGTQVLRRETVDLMAQNHIGPLEVGPLKTAIPSLSNDVELFPGMSKKWGLSFLINTQDAPGGRSAGSLAWAGLANTYFWIDRARNVTGVFLSQVLPFYDETALGLFGKLEAEVYLGL